MKLFKNFKTKKQLREEIKRLETQILISSRMNRNIISESTKTIETVRASIMQNWRDSEVPAEIFKNEIIHNLMEQIKPFIDFQERVEPSGEKVYTGTLYVLRDR